VFGEAVDSASPVDRKALGGATEQGLREVLSNVFPAGARGGMIEADRHSADVERLRLEARFRL
jgi:hypothetical protein